MYECECWTIKKAECQRIDAFELWCWRRLLRVSWTARRSNQSILKKIRPEYSLEGLMLKLKLQYFGHLITKNQLLGKDPDAGKDWRREEKGMTEDEMVGWHHWLKGHEFEQALRVDDGQGGLVCYGSWGHQESDMTERLNWTDWVSDGIQPSHPLSSPSPPAFSLSQHQGLFQWVSSSHQVAKVVEFQLQPQSFQWIFRTDFL